MAIEAARLKAVVTADTSDGERKIKGFVERQASILERGFKGIGATVGLAATTAIAGMAVRSVVELGKMAESTRAVEASFYDLAGAAGQSGDAMLDAMRDASAGTISEYNLMLSANRAMMLGVADSAEELSRLMEIARRRGQAMGLSATQAFNDIVTGLGRGSALILDNLGIIIDLDEAYAAYGVQIGKAASELTDLEKKQAMVNAALRDANTSDAAPMASSFAQMSASIDNMKASLGELFSPAVTAAAEALTQVFDSAREMVEAGQEYFAPMEGSERLLAVSAQLSMEQDKVLRATQEQRKAAYELLDIMSRNSELTFGDMSYAYEPEIVSLAQSIERANALLQEHSSIQRTLTGEVWGAAGAALEETAVSMLNYVAAVEAANEQMSSELRARVGEHNAAIQEMVDGLAWAGVDNLFGALGDDAIKYFDTLGSTAIYTYSRIIALTGNAEFAERRAAEAVSAHAAELATMGTVVDEIRAAEEKAMQEFSTVAQRAAMSAAQDLRAAIGPEAWGYLDEFEMTFRRVYAQWMTESGNAAVATHEANMAVDELAASLDVMNGGGLEEVSDSAFRAAAQIWGTVEAAQALMELLGASQGAVDSAFTGIVGRGISGAEGAALAEARNVLREALIAEMQEMGVGLRDANFALAEFDAETRAITSSISEAWSESTRETTKTTRATTRAGSAATKAADGLGALSSMLSSIPGLFDPSQVTQEQLDMAALGMPQNFADDYLRRLRDEVQNGVDWAGVDIGDAALALGMDPKAAAEQVLAAFEAAWADSSLFADASNMDKFLNMDAMKAALERQQNASQGEANLRALFGIGDADDVNAVAALGLDIQRGLADWLSANGMDDAGAQLARALAGGLQTNDMGEAAAAGMEDFVSSADGQRMFYGIGEDMGAIVASGVSDGIIAGLRSNAPATGGGSGPVAGEGPALSAYSWDLSLPSAARGGVTVNQYNTVTQPYDIDMIAHKAASIIARNSRR